jgi:FkbM family methyltransferase
LAGIDLARVLSQGGDRSRSRHASTRREWLVYGAGSTGRKWAAALAVDGRVVRGFIDQQAVVIGPLPVYRPGECTPELKRDCAVLIGLHNPGVDVGAVRDMLIKDGFAEVWLLQELIDAWPECSHFWLAPSKESLPFVDDIHRAHDSLGDEASRAFFIALLDQRLNGAAGGLPRPDPEHPYFPPDLSVPASPIRFIDCGAYTGDTITSFRRHGFEFDVVAAFEPDPAHFPKLSAVLASECGFAFPCGVWNAMTQLRFAADDAASHFSDDGEITVQTVALDQALPNFAPTLIKMDIEGAESKALCGARGLIERYRPRLAISAYHRPRDLWELLLQIREWDLGYEFHLRGHSFNGFDTVLYGMPTT